MTDAEAEPKERKKYEHGYKTVMMLNTGNTISLPDILANTVVDRGRAILIVDAGDDDQDKK